MESIALAGVLVLITAALLRRYVWGLPEAPSCPTCCMVTRAAVVDDLMPDFLLTSVSVTAVRECTRCGWHGRMRWRWAVRRVRRE